MENIRMDLGEVGCVGVDWIGLAQDKNSSRALVNVAMKFGFHDMMGNYQVTSQNIFEKNALV
jgi:hypothetical protein